MVLAAVRSSAQQCAAAIAFTIFESIGAGRRHVLVLQEDQGKICQVSRVRRARCFCRACFALSPPHCGCSSVGRPPFQGLS